MFDKICLKWYMFKSSRNWKRDWKIIAGLYFSRIWEAIIRIPRPYDDYIPEDMVVRTQKVMEPSTSPGFSDSTYQEKVNRVREVLKEQEGRDE